MTQAARDWLPKHAFTDNAVKAALSEPLGEWAAEWFAHGAISVARVTSVEGRVPAIIFGPSREFQGDIATVKLPEVGKRHLLETALCVDLSKENHLCTADHHVLEELACQMARKLVATLDAALSGPSLHDTLFIGAMVAIDNNDILAISMPASALVPRLKAKIPRSRTLDPVNSRMAALGSIEIVAAGVLGRAELGLDDVKELGVGDILVLDQLHQEPVELRLIDGVIVSGAIARGQLGRNNNRVSIQL